jgi:hypothetical protein
VESGTLQYFDPAVAPVALRLPYPHRLPMQWDLCKYQSKAKIPLRCDDREERNDSKPLDDPRGRKKEMPMRHRSGCRQLLLVVGAVSIVRLGNFL